MSRVCGVCVPSSLPHAVPLSLHKLSEMLDTIEAFSSLGLSHIEGIETMHSRFQLVVAGMKKRPYDLLDQRRSDFDTDFEEFKRQAWEIRVRCSVPEAGV